jgi:hypothetical protein
MYIRQQIEIQLSAKVAEGWNEKDITHIHVNGAHAIVSPANDEDQRRYVAPGNWIYPGVYVTEFNNNLYRVVL